MASGKYDSFNNLRKGKYDWNVRARILNLWRGYTKSGEPFKPFNLLLLDNKRARIHAFVPTNIAGTLEPKLVVGKMYLFRNFTVKEYRPEDKFRCIHKSIQIVFSTETKIVEIAEEDVFIDKAMFDFYDLGDLHRLSKQTTYLTDVIGVIEEEQLHLHRLRNKFGVDQTQMKFHITDGRATVKVTFWDQFAELFSDSLEDDFEYPLIIIIGCGRVSEWQNQIDISNVAATTFYLNYHHHSVLQMRKMLKEPEFTQYRKLFLKRAPPKFYTIEQIKSLGEDSIDVDILCKVIIQQVPQMEPWCYPYCTSCYHPVTNIHQVYHCNQCPRDVPYPEIWYNLSIVAVDETGTINIMLQNLPAQKCLGKKACDIYKEDHDLNYPDILKSIEDKRYIIQLVIKEENIKQMSNVYIGKDLMEEHQFNENDLQMQEQPRPTQESYGEASRSTYHLESSSYIVSS